MIRNMFANRRLGDETWVEYIKRATKRSEDIMTTYGSTNWVQLHHTRKNQFAGKVALQEDQRWNKLLLEWQPMHGRGRQPGRPMKRWTDDLK